MSNVLFTSQVLKATTPVAITPTENHVSLQFRNVVVYSIEVQRNGKVPLLFPLDTSSCSQQHDSKSDSMENSNLYFPLAALQSSEQTLRQSSELQFFLHLC